MGNNPVNYIDPTGHKQETTNDAAGGGATGPDLPPPSPTDSKESSPQPAGTQPNVASSAAPPTEVTRYTDPSSSVVVIVYRDYSWEARFPDGTVLTGHSANVSVDYQSPQAYYLERTARALLGWASGGVIAAVSGGTSIPVQLAAGAAGAVGGEYTLPSVLPIAEKDQITINMHENASCAYEGGFTSSDGQLINAVPWATYDLTQITIQKNYSVAMKSEKSHRERVIRCR